MYFWCICGEEGDLHVLPSAILKVSPNSQSWVGEVLEVTPMPVALLNQFNTSCVEAILQNGQLRRRGKSLTQQIISSEYILVAKILNLQLQRMKAPKQNPNPSSFLYYCRQPRHWQRDCYTFKCFRCLQFSNQPFQCPLILNDRALRNYRGSSQSSLLIGLEKHFSRLGMNLFQS